MPIADATTIADHTGLEAAIANTAASHLGRAERDLRSVLGADRTDTSKSEYDRIVALGTGHDDYQALQEAESLLAVAYAMPFLNLRPTEKGGLVTAVGFDASRVELMRTFDARRLSRMIRQQAHGRIDYLIHSATVDESGDVSTSHSPPFVI
ncbi:MAG: hypothetical protein GVY18_05265 [Bacteroidetes bacterium]|jgi:hypothetical protein|nr:hypothetical protein [Bacteroidota bacterium]